MIHRRCRQRKAAAGDVTELGTRLGYWICGTQGEKRICRHPTWFSGMSGLCLLELGAGMQLKKRG